MQTTLIEEPALIIILKI